MSKALEKLAEAAERMLQRYPLAQFGETKMEPSNRVKQMQEQQTEAENKLQREVGLGQCQINPEGAFVDMNWIYRQAPEDAGRYEVNFYEIPKSVITRLMERVRVLTQMRPIPLPIDLFYECSSTLFVEGF